MGTNTPKALDALLHPRSVAVIGASDDPLRIREQLERINLGSSSLQ